ncbi:hypothetical protein [Candidatus Phycosocius spiralis]|uniref:Uncharacterized protein n=1 Tax=Candidatus Phycosocius spiralis TaxID=2815099 RepID=A0ABQ4PXH1_9PROT|nr:hypothetical protein [Candidatus Phycosocius spiralis]GIU67784.1 hypothetical protein PsB1_1938 [Candidatus Phycosocius spiralis]
MPDLQTSLLNALVEELVIIRDHAMRLETAVSVGALAIGHEGVLDAQSLDYILQALESLAKLIGELGADTPVDQAIMAIPLSQMAKRLNFLDASRPQMDPLDGQTLFDPEMF